jgi:hypothetical protein
MTAHKSNIRLISQILTDAGLADKFTSQQLGKGLLRLEEKSTNRVKMVDIYTATSGRELALHCGSVENRDLVWKTLEAGGVQGLRPMGAYGMMVPVK